MKDFLFTLKKWIFVFEPEIKGGERWSMLRKPGAFHAGWHHTPG